VQLGQDTHEAILRTHLEQLNCFVERSTELVSFTQFPDHVVAQLKKTAADGSITEETVECALLVGADGGHSVVRKQLGVGFLGETREEQGFVVGGIEVEGLSKDVSSVA
jgi:2-polyprenyl-6-methoxyphenol hydroxylase-like FAD-dependent oxidoreductase